MRAFLFDLFCRPEGMVLYLITEEGRRLRVLDHFTPSVYLSGPERTLAACLETLSTWQDDVVIAGKTHRRDFWTGADTPVVELRIKSPYRWHRGLLQRLYRQHPDVDFHNADLLPEQHYAFDRQLVPAGYCRVDAGERGIVRHIESDDDVWRTDYKLPELCTMELDGDGLLHGGRPRMDWLSARIDGIEHRFDTNDPAEMIQSLNRLVRLHDPDVMRTRGGDAFLIPLLLVMQQNARDWDGEPVSIQFDREPPPEPRELRLEGRSYFSYGRVLYQAPDYPFFGRWHLDELNSFMVEHTGLDGLIEVARVSRLPVQRIGRRSIGTGITSIQLESAFRKGFLIPWKKSEPEGWKTAAQLLATDRGGLVYQPLAGAYENVIEIDFVSMYPTIMSRFNISPETINCRCCHNGKVPEIGYTICENRRGLVPDTLEPIISKRVRYKQIRGQARIDKVRELEESADARQSALKWLLVCCFGYLGYRNARFGRIEAHEAVCAFARDRLMQAREICERRGFRVLHAIVDCFWCQRDPGHAGLGPPTRAEIEALCQDIHDATELPIALEGVYKWIAFLPSRQNPEMPVPNRFFGRFEDGSVKMRGIEARRHDLPPFVRNVQKRCIDMLAGAGDLAGYRERIPDLLRMLGECENLLERGEVPREHLIITRHLSMNPEDYRGHNMIAIAARQARLAGLELRAGMPVSYLIVRQHDRDPMQRVCLAQLLQPETLYDSSAYRRLLRRGFQTLLRAAGYDLEENPRKHPRKPGSARPRRRTTQGDLFDLATENETP